MNEIKIQIAIIVLDEAINAIKALLNALIQLENLLLEEAD